MYNKIESLHDKLVCCCWHCHLCYALVTIQTVTNLWYLASYYDDITVFYARFQYYGTSSHLWVHLARLVCNPNHDKKLSSPPWSFKAATHTLYVCCIINPVELHLCISGLKAVPQESTLLSCTSLAQASSSIFNQHVLQWATLNSVCIWPSVPTFFHLPQTLVVLCSHHAWWGIQKLPVAEQLTTMTTA